MKTVLLGALTILTFLPNGMAAEEDAACRRAEELLKETRTLSFIGREKENVALLMREHEVTAEDLIYFAENCDKSLFLTATEAWKVAILSGSETACEAFATKLIEGQWSDGRSGRLYFLTAEMIVSPELCRALLRRLEGVPVRKYSRDQLCAFDYLCECSFEEAVPLIRRFILGHMSRHQTESYVCDAIKSLGKLRSENSLEALREAWLNRRREHGILCALAIAIGSHGDAGVRALQETPEESYVFLGLEYAATPLAVEVAEQLCDRESINSLCDLLRVKVAAGDPFRTKALLEALKAGGWLTEQALQMIGGSHVFAEEVREEVRRLALTEGRTATYAVRVLSRWEGHRRERQNVTWAEPVGALAVGAGTCAYSDGRDNRIECEIFFRNDSEETVKLTVVQGMLHLVAPDGSPIVEEGESRQLSWRLEPGTVSVRHIQLRVQPIPYEGVRELRFRLRMIARPEDYRFPDGWVGTLVTPPFELSVPAPLDNEDLDHWRALLQAGKESGRLPDGGLIDVFYSEDVPHSAALRGSHIEGKGIWLALPKDLLEVRPEEVSSVCSFLLEDDNFLDPIKYLDGFGKYMPRAEIKLHSASRRAEWGECHFKKEFWAGWRKDVHKILAPRLDEARRRVGLQPWVGNYDVIR